MDPEVGIDSFKKSMHKERKEVISKAPIDKLFESGGKKAVIDFLGGNTLKGNVRQYLRSVTYKQLENLWQKIDYAEFQDSLKRLFTLYPIVLCNVAQNEDVMAVDAIMSTLNISDLEQIGDHTRKNIQKYMQEALINNNNKDVKEYFLNAGYYDVTELQDNKELQTVSRG